MTRTNRESPREVGINHVLQRFKEDTDRGIRVTSEVAGLKGALQWNLHGWKRGTGV